MNANKKRIYILILFATILISIVGAISYGFFDTDLENKIVGNYVIDFGEDYTFSVSGGSTSDITLSDFEMFGQGYDVEVVNETTTLTLELQNDNEESSLTCTYVYKWRWDLTYDSYEASDENTPEYVVSGPFAQTQVPNYNSTTNLGSGLITALAGETKTEEVDITTKFYNLANIDQGIHAGKTYKGGVIIDNVTCTNN